MEIINQYKWDEKDNPLVGDTTAECSVAIVTIIIDWFTAQLPLDMLLILLSKPPTIDRATALHNALRSLLRSPQGSSSMARRGFVKSAHKTITDQLPTINISAFRRSTMKVLHPDQLNKLKGSAQTFVESHATSIKNCREALQQFIDPKETPRRADELNPSESFDPWKLSPSVMFTLHARERVVVTRITLPDSKNCFAVWIRDQHDRTEPGRLPFVLARWTTGLGVQDDRHKPYAMSNCADVPVSHFDTLLSKALLEAFPRAKHHLGHRGQPIWGPGYLLPSVPWMMSPALPSVLNSCWIITCCALLTESTNFMEAVSQINVDEESSDSASAAYSTIHILQTIKKALDRIGNQSLSDRAKSAFSKKLKRKLKDWIKNIAKQIPDISGKGDNRFLISEVAALEPIQESPLSPVLMGSYMCARICGNNCAPIVEPVHIKGGTDSKVVVGVSEPVPYAIGYNGNFDDASDTSPTVHSLADLIIGGSTRSSSCRCKGQIAHETLCHKAWVPVGEPPAEIIAVTWETISSRINMNPGVIEYRWVEDKNSTEIKVTHYRILALAIGVHKSDHQIIAVPAPSFGFTPFQWSWIDNLTSKPKSAANLPTGTIASFVLRRCEDSLLEFDGLPDLPVDRSKVIQFQHSFDIITPDKSLLWHNMNQTVPESDPGLDNKRSLTIAFEFCLGEEYGCNCKYNSTNEGNPSIWVILRLIQQETFFYVSERKYQTTSDALIKHHYGNVKSFVVQVAQCEGKGYKCDPVSITWKKNDSKKPRKIRTSTTRYHLKVARLTLQEITSSPRTHVYLIDFLESIVENETHEDYWVKDSSMKGHELPAGICMHYPVDAQRELQDISIHLLTKHEELVEHVVTLENSNLQ